jgi:pyruvate dehydrogenase (quinone)
LAARYTDTKERVRFFLSGTLATMACGLPYAIAAKIAYPEKESIAFVGDGGLTMLMGEFATAVQYNLPIKVIVIKNNSLGMIRWEQMAFLGNPEYGIEFTPIDYAKFAEACGGIGYHVEDPEKLQSTIHCALRKEVKKPVIIEIDVDPFEPPMPPKTDMEFVTNLAQSFAKGQPYSGRMKLTLFRNKVHEALRENHSHETS